MLRYYITGRHSSGVGVHDLLAIIERSVAARVNYIQIREKDLDTRISLDLVRAAVELARSSTTRILVNDRVDVALAAGAHGAHLRSDGISVAEWRRVLPEAFLLARSCHTPEEVRGAQDANFLVFGPVFASPGKGPAQGLAALGEATEISRVPVLALGGISEANAEECIRHGAAGIAGIRMFQQPELLREPAAAVKIL